MVTGIPKAWLRCHLLSELFSDSRPRPKAFSSSSWVPLFFLLSNCLVFSPALRVPALTSLGWGRACAAGEAQEEVAEPMAEVAEAGLGLESQGEMG